MLSSSGKRVDDVMVVVRGNWEFGEGEDRLDPIPRRRGEPGNDSKKFLTSTDGAVLSTITVALKYFGRPSLQRQGREAHVLLHYEPTYTTFSGAENIPIPKVAEVAKSDQSEAEVDEALKLAFEEVDLNSADPPSTSGRGDLPFEDVFNGLEDLPGTYPEDMAGLSLTQLAKKANAERMATRRRAEAIRSQVPTAAESQPSLPVTESQPPLPVKEMAKNQSAEFAMVVQADQEAEQRTEKRPAEVEAGSENRPDKRPCLEELDVIVPFVIQPKIKNSPISSDASVIKDPVVALSMATSVSLPADKATFRSELDLVAIALATQSALLVYIFIFFILCKYCFGSNFLFCRRSVG
ncbi:hypothetical protein CsSME_00053055 [Camellia sinensis var. sinensis]